MRKKIYVMALAAVSAATVWAGGLKTGQLSNVTRLTNDNGVKYENPQFAPDGQTISFTEFGYKGLYTIKADGSNKNQISDAPGVGYMYQWSPDSRQLLARDTRWLKDAGRVHSAVVYDLAGKATQVTADANDMQPAVWRFSRDGKTLVAHDGIPTEVTNTAVKRMALKQGQTMEAVRALPAYNLTYYCDYDNLFAVDADGNKTRVCDGPAFRASLSPNGKLIVFSDMYDNIKVMNPDGTNQRTIAKGQNPIWLNDQQVAYERTTDDGHTYKTGEIYMANVATGAEKALTSTPSKIEMNISVSPDGNKVLFSDFNDGQIYIADLK